MLPGHIDLLLQITSALRTRSSRAQGDDAVVLAPTAGGKTEASMFPTLSGMVEDQPTAVGAIYVAPIKALLNNQSDRLGLYTEMVGLRHFVWHGDTTDHERRQFLREPAELLMTTPESLEVMLASPRIDAKLLFGDLRVVIIDEIHAVAGTDRGAHLMSVLERIARFTRHDVQRIGLSATVGNPEVILRWLQGTSQRPGKVVDPPRTPSKRQLLVIHRPGLAEIAQDAARMAKGTKSLFFCQSRATTEAVAEQMRRDGTTVFVHHSAVSKEERQLAEELFHRGSDACIVCTSTLELGIDVGDLDRVLQADAPDTVGAFLQRMGRTGRRAGQVANTTFFCQTDETVLQAIALIELAKSGWVENVDSLELLIRARRPGPVPALDWRRLPPERNQGCNGWLRSPISKKGANLLWFQDSAENGKLVNTTRERDFGGTQSCWSGGSIQAAFGTRQRVENQLSIVIVEDVLSIVGDGMVMPLLIDGDPRGQIVTCAPREEAPFALGRGDAKHTLDAGEAVEGHALETSPKTLRVGPHPGRETSGPSPARKSARNLDVVTIVQTKCVSDRPRHDLSGAEHGDVAVATGVPDLCLPALGRQRVLLERENQPGTRRDLWPWTV